MVATGLVGLWLRWRGRLYDTPLFARWCLLMGPSGFVALLAGWFVTETGRQPYTVYGLLRTANSVSPVASRRRRRLAHRLRRASTSSSSASASGTCCG